MRRVHSRLRVKPGFGPPGDPKWRDGPAIYLPPDRFAAMFVTRARPPDLARARFAHGFLVFDNEDGLP